MRRTISVCAAMVLLFAVTAFGAEDKFKITISQPVTVSGTRLQPGDYTVKYDNAQKIALFTRGGKKVATVPASEQPMAEKVGQTESLYDHNRLQEIRRHDTRLVFDTGRGMQPGAVGGAPATATH